MKLSNDYCVSVCHSGGYVLQVNGLNDDGDEVSEFHVYTEIGQMLHALRSKIIEFERFAQGHEEAQGIIDEATSKKRRRWHR